MTIGDDRLLWSPADVAAKLGIPIGSVKYLHRIGDLPGVTVGRRLRFKPEAVLKYVEQLEPKD